MSTRTHRVLLATAAITLTGAAPAWAYVNATIRTSMTLTVARLAAPTGTTTADGNDVVIAPVAAKDGPSPTSFDVIRVPADGGAGTPLCTAIAAGASCRDPGAVDTPSGASYVVTAHLGTHWTAASAAIPAPEPAPAAAPAIGLSQSDISDTPTPAPIPVEDPVTTDGAITLPSSNAGSAGQPAASVPEPIDPSPAAS